MHSKTAKYLLTFIVLVTIIIPTIMDFNDTHMTNPLWAPHARFHWSIQWYSITTLNCMALYLIWGNYKEKGSRLSTVFAVLSPILFWGSFFPSLLMPGTSPWPDGVVPFATYPPNIFIAGILVTLSILSFWLEMRSRPKHALAADS
jgi:hypothetical protein